MQQIRTFIAIELPEEIKGRLSHLIEELKPGKEQAVKWVNPDSLHLTLKFLGNVSIAKVPEITGAIERVTAGMKPCQLGLEELGAFPNAKSPQVVWVGISGEVAHLIDLQKRIDQALVPLGFPPETKAFSPHLTLGRVRDKASPNERIHLGKALQSHKVKNGPAFTVDKVAFLKSTLTSSGPIYNRLGLFDLTEIGGKC